MIKFFKENWFKISLLLLGIALIIIVGFYLIDKNRLEKDQIVNQEKNKQIDGKEEIAPVFKDAITSKPKNVQVEMEKCRFKYIESKTADTIEEFSKFVLEPYRKAIAEDPNLDKNSMYDALKDSYFSNKYQDCLNNIK